MAMYVARHTGQACLHVLSHQRDKQAFALIRERGGAGGVNSSL